MSDPGEIPRLHARYREQASWTHSIRRALYQEAGLAGAKRVLEVGSGTGVITRELAPLLQRPAVGLDIDQHVVRFAHVHDRRCRYLVGDVLRLPFPESSFDVTLCHFLLLWIDRQAEALSEIARVTSSGGAVLSLAEPDYGGRIDHPPELERLGHLQEAALISQGAQTRTGRRLRKLFVEAGLCQVRVGVLGGEWGEPPSAEALESEWRTLQADLAGRMAAQELEDLREIDVNAWRASARILFVPTFYAIGWKR